MNFSVMTWNVENFFPPGSRPSPQSAPITQAQFDAKATFLRDTIADKNPDVVALQEVGGTTDASVEPLDELQTLLGGAYPHRAVGKADTRRIRVAFLSKLPLAAVDRDSLLDFPAGPLNSVPDTDGGPITKMGRGGLKIEVEPVPGKRIRLITAHLKSKLLTYKRPDGSTAFSPRDEDERAQVAGIALFRRAAEAVTIRSFLNAAMKTDPGVHSIVLGDMNDEPLAATSQILLGPGDRDVLSSDQGDAVRMFNVTDPLPLRGNDFQDFRAASERFTRIHEARLEMIDHIYLSHGLLVRNGAFALQEVRSFVDLIRGQDVGDNPGTRAGKERPDHAPVLARIAV